jgi:hypothetical protein
MWLPHPSAEKEPIATISQLHFEMSEILGPLANKAGRETGFTKRQSKLSGSVFAQALVFSSMADEDLTYTLLAKEAAIRGAEVSPQGMEQRFTEASARLMQVLLDTAVHRALNGATGQKGLTQFSGIYLRDSSVIHLPTELKHIWSGVGGITGETAAVKLQTRLEYLSGQVAGPDLQSGRSHDKNSIFHSEELPAGSLRLGDLGYFDLDQFQKDSESGIFWLSRYKTNTYIYNEAGQEIALLPWLHSITQSQVEISILLGKMRLPCRLLVQRVPQEVADKRRHKLKEYARKKQVAPSALLMALTDWTLILTNIPANQITFREILVLMKVRWQIELLFKAWKSLFKIDEWRSANPWRILTELYAKLLAIVVFHWFTLLEGYQAPERSAWKSALIFKRFALSFALSFDSVHVFEAVASAFIRSVQKAARLNTRSAQPNTIQDLLQCTSLA